MNFPGKVLAAIMCFTIAGGLSSTPALAKIHKHKRKSVSAPAKTRYSSAVTYDAASLAAVINNAVASAGGNTVIGVEVKSMSTGATLYDHNEHQLFTPASILKVLTAEAALLYLGPDYKYKTQVMTDAKTTTNGIVMGDIYLVHSGDPSLTYYDMTDLMVSLKSQQIQGISGNAYIDTTAYDQNNYGPGWIEKDMRYCYAAPINASIINHNCISFEVAPAKQEGKLASVIQSPRYFYPGIYNSVVTRPFSSKGCSVRLQTNDDNTIALSGCMAKGNYSRGASIVITNMVQYNKSMLRNLFNQYGIQVNNPIGAKEAPPNLSVIAEHDSKPLYMLITEMLKKSDNIIAGSLFKKIGEVYTRQPGSWSNGSSAIKQILTKKAGVNTSQMVILDGSGLSRDNRVTPSQIMQALDFAFHNDATNYEFISALPIAGVDGTLKRRLGNVARKVRAKTGTMAGVVSLAGYAVSKNKEPLAFVIIVNGQHGSIWKYREIEDRIVTALTNYQG